MGGAAAGGGARRSWRLSGAARAAEGCPDAPFIREEEASRNYYDVRCGADHTCLTLFSATGSGPSDRVSS